MLPRGATRGHQLLLMDLQSEKEKIVIVDADALEIPGAGEGRNSAPRGELAQSAHREAFADGGDSRLRCFWC